MILSPVLSEERVQFVDSSIANFLELAEWPLWVSENLLERNGLDCAERVRPSKERSSVPPEAPRLIGSTCVVSSAGESALAKRVEEHVSRNACGKGGKTLVVLHGSAELFEGDGVLGVVIEERVRGIGVTALGRGQVGAERSVRTSDVSTGAGTERGDETQQTTSSAR
jgi:hypothetical protein